MLNAECSRLKAQGSRLKAQGSKGEQGNEYVLGVNWITGEQLIFYRQNIAGHFFSRKPAFR